jgi:hypothetical protein
MKKTPRVTRAELVDALDRLCDAVGTVSRGFNVEAIDGPDQWALRYCRGYGWMVVCGLGGCGCALSRANGFVRNRWSLLMALEMARTVAVKTAKGVTVSHVGQNP